MGGESSLDRLAVAAPSPRPFFNPWVTVLWALLVAVLIGFFVAYLYGRPLELLEWPEASLARLVAREMELRAALREAPGWERRLHQALLSSDAEALEDAIAWYDELVGAIESPAAEMDRLVLLGEAGRRDSLAAGFATREPDAAAWLRAAYLEAPAEPDARATLLAQIREASPADWFADVLRGRVAAGLGDAATQAAAQSAVAERGRVLLRRWRALLGAEVLVIAVAAGLLAGLWRRRSRLALGEAALPPRWTIADGFGLFLRGAGGYLVITMVVPTLAPPGAVPEAWATLAAGLPTAWWLARYLRARGAPVLGTLGLRLVPGRTVRLAVVTVVLIGMSLLGELTIAVLAGGLHVKTHWSDGFPEVALWGGPGRVTEDAVDAVVWAPLVEEVGFRGILYPTLRAGMAAGPAAALSGAVFALLHGYGVAGFASVLWSGVLWALAYERTRSLLPGMLAHAAGNLVTTLAFLWLLRL